MFAENPFAALNAVLPAYVMQLYIVLMVVAVAAGTLIDTLHKGSARFFSQRRKKTMAAAQRKLSGGHTAALAVKTVVEAAISGEFCKLPRRLSHLLMMYGFLLYVVTTVIMVYGYPDPAVAIPFLLPTLWDIGALMIVVGGLWFFLLLRVNVAFEGDSPFHVGRADLFVLSLIGSAVFALIWHGVQSASENTPAAFFFFALYLAFTTLLFGSVFWSKFAHMFYKPVVAFQRRVEDANGATDLPTPLDSRHCTH